MPKYIVAIRIGKHKLWAPKNWPSIRRETQGTVASAIHRMNFVLSLLHVEVPMALLQPSRYLMSKQRHGHVVFQVVSSSIQLDLIIDKFIEGGEP